MHIQKLGRERDRRANGPFVAGLLIEAVSDEPQSDDLVIGLP